MIRLTRLGFFFVLLLAVVFYWENPAPAADVGRPDPGYSFPPAFALASISSALIHQKRLA